MRKRKPKGQTEGERVSVDPARLNAAKDGDKPVKMQSQGTKTGSGNQNPNSKPQNELMV